VPERQRRRRRQKHMGEGRTGERATGTPNEIYDLSSVLFHALEGGASYDQYIHDAEEAGDHELADFFRRVRDEDSMRADEAQRLLAERTLVGAGREGAARRPTEGSAAGVSPRTEASSPPPGVADAVPPTRAGEASSRAEEVSPRPEEAPPLGRERRAGQPEREREEDKGLLDRARDALTGEEEEEPRRREEPGTRREAPRGPQGDEPLR
jgi:hypothetical protein